MQTKFLHSQLKNTYLNSSTGNQSSNISNNRRSFAQQKDNRNNLHQGSSLQIISSIQPRPSQKIMSISSSNFDSKLKTSIQESQFQNKPIANNFNIEGYQYEVKSKFDSSQLVKNSLSLDENLLALQKINSIQKNGRDVTNLPSLINSFQNNFLLHNLIDPNVKSVKRMSMCTPNCQRDHQHHLQYDYNQNYQNPLSQRPGAQAKNLSQSEIKNLQKINGICNFGKKQSPINLETQMKIYENFQDEKFEVNYNKIENNVNQKKVNKQTNDIYYELQINENGENQNVMQTKTINLFDKHIRSAQLIGQHFHFHSPSEHSIDGQLLDLEMHIVHQIQPKHSSRKQSQFSFGVLGVLFKVVPDNYFIENENEKFHDTFLQQLLNEQNQQENDPLDMTEFVQKLDYDRRWTYQGSLTTQPYSEGLLWNVIEQVVPISQKTLDLFNEFKQMPEIQELSDIQKGEQILEEKLNGDEEVIEQTLILNDEQPLLRIASSNRPVQDIGKRKVYHIDVRED